MKTNEQPTALKELSIIARTINNSTLQEWKKGGGKVVGYFCSFIPEEILLAGGLLPFRIRGTGSTGSELADEYFTEISCSFPRHCLNQALKGEYAFLDGFVGSNACDHLRHMWENWKISKLGTPYLYFLLRPTKYGEDTVGYFRARLVDFRKSLEAHFGVTISDDSLQEAIKRTNETRRLQRQIYDMRKAEQPPITGAEMVAVMVAGFSMPKALYQEKLTKLLGDLPVRKVSADHPVRVMLLGAENDDPTLSNLIEEQGGIVVTDQTCFGTRTMWELVDEKSNDPLDALARYYTLERPSCPRIWGDHPRRARQVIQMARDFRVDAIVGEALLSCDMWTTEYYMLKDDLKEAGIPFQQISKEYVPTFVGQMRTRIQAFLETIRG
jgi:benzoyl-CoA reductase subunit C